MAGQLFVFAFQCKLGVVIVLETDLLPFYVVMTSVAFFTKQSVMAIVGAMAVVTAACLFVALLVQMAGLTFHIFMSTFQREVSFSVMVKFTGIPVAWGMALSAIPPLCPVMSVVDAVTTEAIIRCVFVALVNMANITFCFTVLTF